MCGKRSARRWNLQRHINDVHGVMADNIQKTVERSGIEEQVIRTKLIHTETSGASNDLSTKNGFAHTPRLSEIFDKRVNAQIRSAASALLTANSTYRRYRGRVCKRCLSVFLQEVGSNPFKKREAAIHDCNDLWLIDYPKLEERKEDLLSNLQSRLPQLMTRILVEVSRKLEVRLLCMKWDRRFTEEFPRPPVTDQNPFINSLLLGSYLKELDLFRHSNATDAVPLKINFVDDNHWAKRAIRNDSTELSEDEISEFIKIRNSTFGVFSVAWSDNLYFFQIVLKKSSLEIALF